MSFLYQFRPTRIISCALQMRRRGLAGARVLWACRVGLGSWCVGGGKLPEGKKLRGACLGLEGTHLEVSTVAHVEGLEELLWAGHLSPYLFPQPGRAETR